MADAKAPNPEGDGEEGNTESRGERIRHCARAAEDDAHREVGNTADRHDVDEKVAKPPGVDVERVLAGLDSAVGESVRELEALDCPEGECRLQEEDSAEQRDSTGDGET